MESPHLQPKLRIGHVHTRARVGDGDVRLQPARGVAKLQLPENPQAADTKMKGLVSENQLCRGYVSKG